MSSYIFDNQSEVPELERLRLIENALDATTIEHLKRAGIHKGMRCLEIGPGAGSILNWMGECVGRHGLVVGVDTNTRFLSGFNSAPYEIIEGDIGAITLNHAFDLVHCRYVLIHNPNALDILKKIRQLLKPAGFVVIEEPDFTSAKLSNNENQTHAHVGQAICAIFRQKGLNPGYGLHLTNDLQKESYEILETDTRMHLCAGGSPIAKVMTESTKALKKAYLDTGEVTEEELKSYLENAADPNTWSVYYTTISAIAKTPPYNKAE